LVLSGSNFGDVLTDELAGLLKETVRATLGQPAP
jgi:hypothetical protein